MDLIDLVDQTDLDDLTDMTGLTGLTGLIDLIYNLESNWTSLKKHQLSYIMNLGKRPGGH